MIDHTQHEQPAPEMKVEPPLEKFAARNARYLRVLVTRLLQENELFSSFALGELQVYSAGKNVALGKAVLALDSVESPGWSKAYLVDGRTEPIRQGTIQQPATLLRKSFAVRTMPSRAILYVTARGLYELHVNGNRVGEHLLAPEWTVYDKRIQYQAYDVTSYVRAGENVLAANLAAGWYSGKVGLVPTRKAYGEVPQLLVHLELQNQSGQKQVVVSDGSWRRFSDGPIRSADIYDGETYDARKEVPGWDRPGFDDAAWKAAQVTPDTDAVELSWQRNDAIRAAQEIRPVSIRQSRPGVYIFDLGQNMVGWVQLKVNGPAQLSSCVTPRLSSPMVTCTPPTCGKPGKLTGTSCRARVRKFSNPTLPTTGSATSKSQGFPSRRPRRQLPGSCSIRRRPVWANSPLPASS